MKYNETKRHSKKTTKTSVDLSNEQVDFFHDNQDITKKTCWDLGVFLAYALRAGLDVVSVEVGGDEYTIEIKKG